MLGIGAPLLAAIVWGALAASSPSIDWLPTIGRSMPALRSWRAAVEPPGFHEPT